MEFCPALGLTIPVGKDSMSMRTTWRDGEEDKAVTAPVSLVISAFTPVPDVRGSVTPQLCLDDDAAIVLVDLSTAQSRLGGSALAQVYSQLGTHAPDVSASDLKALFVLAQETLQAGKVLACHDRSDGGLIVTLLEMAFAARCGLDISLDAGADDALDALFNEEVGLVLQLKGADVEAFLARAAELGLGAKCRVIGKAVAGEDVFIRGRHGVIVEDSRVRLQQLWSRGSYEIQALRDNPDCAKEEFARIAKHDPGLSPLLSFDQNDDISAPYINGAARPKIAVLREQGVNGQVEMAAAFHKAGFAPFDVHMSDLFSGNYQLADFQGLVACGGFSYGDVLGAGEGWAKSILFNSALRDQFAEFFERPDSFALGVCNGCQMMANLKSLIPGAEHWPHFVRNRSEQFEARLSLVEVGDSPSVLLHGMNGSRLPVAVAHGEGRAEFADGKQQACAADKLIALNYVENSGERAISYPANPNGSPDGITGLCSRDGRVTIMMPHPERVFRTSQLSWAPADWPEDSPWLRLFRNARRFVG
ncbi:MAG: phosphoribosylformylglycinamidine synthase [Gammaproteobacteria bacterium]|nr:MAG: phosphoribosylformylglycinamidine synthase [Gammaproteobacteria bacterium]